MSFRSILINLQLVSFRNRLLMASVVFCLILFVVSGLFVYVIQNEKALTMKHYPWLIMLGDIEHNVTQAYLAQKINEDDAYLASRRNVNAPLAQAFWYLNVLENGGAIDGVYIERLEGELEREQAADLNVKLRQLSSTLDISNGGGLNEYGLGDQVYYAMYSNFALLRVMLEDRIAMEAASGQRAGYVGLASFVIFIIVTYLMLIILEKGIEVQRRKRKKDVVRFKYIFNSVADSLLLVDHAGVILTENTASKMMLANNDSLVGTMVKEYVDIPDMAEIVVMASDETHDCELGKPCERIAKKTGGGSFPADVTITQMMEEDGEMYVVVVRDVSDRKHMDKMKNEFISTVSHELRTPLTSIRGALGLLVTKEVEGMSPRMKMLGDIAYNNTERLLLLINDLLDLQKIEAGKMVYNFIDMCLDDVVQLAIESNENYAEQRNVTFNLGYSDKNIHVNGDSDRLIQVMNNLMSNAAKYSDEGGQVDISVASNERSVRVSVTDYGEGIPDEFRDYIFKKFAQADSSDTRKIGGTGLGLNIAKSIVESHGGKIGFITEHGVGTTMYFDLPCCFYQGDLNDDVTGLLKTTYSNEAKKILVVEDDVDVAAILRRILVETGADVDVAHNAAEAKSMLASNHYDCMTLDMLLPDGDGEIFIKAVQAEGLRYSSVPIVVISAEADERKQKLSGGAVNVMAWLNKPVRPAELISLVNGVEKKDDLHPTLLHVEDDPSIRAIVKTVLGDGLEYCGVTSCQAAREKLSNVSFDLILLDIGLPDGSGLDLLVDIERNNSAARVVVFTAAELNFDEATKVEQVLLKARTTNHDLAAVVWSILDRNKSVGDDKERSA